jgi:phosphoribosyl-ATP pyrophosphohydrolase/phosphoribosyl-AMP cyclohydrolase
MNLPDVRFDERGLVPGIVQDAVTRRVLMVGYLNAESIARTRDTGLVTFWSRSRNELWQKGETSGHVLELVDMAVDCDGDALLISAVPRGPTCHTGAVSCFDDDLDQGFAWLERLWSVIAARTADLPEGSYTAALLAGGVDAAGRKVTEEATEVLLAAKDHAAGGPATRLAEEAADLLYHLLVLLAERGLAPAAVLAELRRRAG